MMSCWHSIYHQRFEHQAPTTVSARKEGSPCAPLSPLELGQWSSGKKHAIFKDSTSPNKWFWLRN